MKKTVKSSLPLTLVDDEDPMQSGVMLVQVSHVQAPGYIASIELFAEFHSSTRYLTTRDLLRMRDWIDAELQAEADAEVKQ